MTLQEKIRWHFQQKIISVTKFFYSTFIGKVKVEGIYLPVKYSYSNRVFQFIIKGEYERPEIECVKKHLTTNDRVVEFGSGLGLLSAYCALITGNDNVHTFEGNEKLATIIQETYSLNKVNPSITFSLVGNEKKQVAFNVEPKDVWASSVITKSATSRVVLKNQLKANDIIAAHQPTFLIIDIEGAEQDLLPTLDLANVKKLQIEFHPLVYGDETMKKLMAIIESKGFVKESDDDPQSFYFYKPA
ncbi:MAG: FkbM family methyltransferase [Chitinophagaceae bacterium]|nr:FkbM family methyltransferase [Chitinophagaceae bacterium]